jgi:hypothetical protein
MRLGWAQIWAQSQLGKNSVMGNCLKRVVGRDGIEPPTPGFSVLSPTSRKCIEVFDLEQQARDGVVRWSALE